MSGQKTDAQQTMLDSLSDLLDMSSEDLEASLRSGTSLVDLLDQKGVSLNSLADSLQSGFLVDQRL
jgi:lambda repressor-like predicted transcriptional regulator